MVGPVQLSHNYKYYGEDAADDAEPSADEEPSDDGEPADAEPDAEEPEVGEEEPSAEEPAEEPAAEEPETAGNANTPTLSAKPYAQLPLIWPIAQEP